MRAAGWGRTAADLGAAWLFLGLAGWVTGGLWPRPGGRELALNAADQTLFEWFLAADTRLLTGHLALVTDRLNAPDGVNLMANTSVIVLGVLFAPLTVLAGAPVTFAVLLGLNLAGTAIAWYLLFTRLLRARWPAAVLGGGLCGFAPGIVSQSNGHLHMTAQFLVPAMVWLVVRLARAADPRGAAAPDDPSGAPTLAQPPAADPRPARPGPGRPDWRAVVSSAGALAALVIVQVFIGEEVLFLTAVTLLLVCLGYAARRPRHTLRLLPGFLTGLVLTAALATVALAYPLWAQFFGPHRVPTGTFPPGYFSADLASFLAVSPLSVLGNRIDASGLGAGPAEYTAFFGRPLVIVALAAACWLWRRPLVAACAAAALVLTAVSLGPQLLVGQRETGIPGPYRLLEGLPLVDGALPTRFALALVPLIATVLVLAVDRAARSSRPGVRLFVPAFAVGALLPAVPAPLPATDRTPLPTFITQGHWRDCVRPGGVLVPVPLPTPEQPWTMRWAAATNVSFGIPQGFFIGAYGAEGGPSMGVYSQPTAQLLADVTKAGHPPVRVSAEQRDNARRDVAHWGASCVALATGTPHAEALRVTCEQLFGPATRVADAWTWRVG